MLEALPQDIRPYIKPAYPSIQNLEARNIPKKRSTLSRDLLFKEILRELIKLDIQLVKGDNFFTDGWINRWAGRALAQNVGVDVKGKAPTNPWLHQHQAFIETLHNANDRKMFQEIGFGGFQHCSIIRLCRGLKNMELHAACAGIELGHGIFYASLKFGRLEPFLQSHKLVVPVFFQILGQFVPPVIVQRYHPFHRLPQYGDIPARPWEVLVHAKAKMPLHNPELIEITALKMFFRRYAVVKLQDTPVHQVSGMDIHQILLE